MKTSFGNQKIIQKDDYDLYKILIPFNLHGNKRKKYINRELEKMHPGFSDLCVYDLKYTFGHKKLIANVAVMNALKLAEYQFRSKKSLKLEGLGKARYFGQRNTLLNIIFILTFILSISIGISVVTKNHRKSLQEKLENIGNDELLLEDNETESFSTAYIIPELFLNIGKLGCKIKSFSLEVADELSSEKKLASNFTAEISSSTDSFSRESILDFFNSLFLVSTNNVLNEQNISSFNFDNEFTNYSLNLKSSEKFASGISLCGIDVQTQNKIVSELMKMGACVEISDFEAKKIIFTVNENKMKEVFEYLHEFSDANKIFAKKINCSVNQDFESESLNCAMEFAVHSNDMNPFSCIGLMAENCNIFLQNKNQKTAADIRKRIESSDYLGQEIVMEKSSLLLGKVRKKNGKRILFYKNRDGKIIKMEE